MSKRMSDLELFERMTPKEQAQYLTMLGDIASLGPKPTRQAALEALLPHLEDLFGETYEDYKPELEAKYGEELVAVHNKNKGKQ